LYIFFLKRKTTPSNLTHQVKVLYDNTAIYIGAYLKTTNQIKERTYPTDNAGVAEHLAR
jgi:hypothetical protein